LREAVKQARWLHYRRQSSHRGKVVVQSFLSGLDHDIKVLVFGDRYYPLTRKNRPGDFRASGGGRLSFDLGSELTEVLDYAEGVKSRLPSPFCSLDVALTPNGAQLIEFQCVSFGPYAMQFADGYYCRSLDGDWVFRSDRSSLECVWVEAALKHFEAGLRDGTPSSN